MNEWILSSTVLILAVVIGRFLLKGKISLRLQYALWALVLVRLLVPVQFFTSALSVSSAAQSQDVDLAEPVRQVYSAVQAPRYEAEYDVIYAQILQSQPSSAPDTAAVEQETLEQVARKQEADVTSLLYGAWFTGIGVMALVLVASNVHFARRLRRSRREVEIPGCLLRVYETDVVPTPCLFGLFHPAIYLTSAVARDERVRTHVLAHELTHYRHLDHIWAVLRGVCLALHWYNPLVWLAAKLSKEDAELACDEGALLRLGEEQRAEYGRTLISLTCAEGPGTGMVAATTMTAGKHAIARRLKTLMKRPRTAAVTLIAVIAAAAVVVGCTFSGAPETTEPQTEPHPGQVQAEEGLIVFPGTWWNMSPEELIAGLELEAWGYEMETQEPTEGDPYARTVIGVEDMDVMGYPAYVVFRFCAYTEADYRGLNGVEVRYNDGVDMEAVLQTLSEELGDYDTYEEENWTYLWKGEETLWQYYPDYYREMIEREYAADPERLAEELASSATKLRVVVDPEKQIFLPYLEPHTSGMYFLSSVAQGLQLQAQAEQQASKDPDDPRLTTEELMEIVYDLGINGRVSSGTSSDGRSVAYFYKTYFASVEELNLEEFIGAMSVPYSAPSREEYQAMTAHPAWPTEEEMWKLEKHVRVTPEQIDEVLRQWTDITYEDLVNKEKSTENLIYLEEFDVYHGFSEDNGYSSFGASSGIRREDGLIELYSKDAVLVVRPVEGGYQIVSHLPLETEDPGVQAVDQAAEVASLFGSGADQWYLAGLTTLYSHHYNIDVAEYFCSGQSGGELTAAEEALIAETYGEAALAKPIFRMTYEEMDQVLQAYLGMDVVLADTSDFLFCPETRAFLRVQEEESALELPQIISCQVLAENKVTMIYTLPGSSQRYAATLYKEETWTFYSNYLLLEKPQDARELTAEEVEQVNTAFESILFGEAEEEPEINPVSAFFTSSYEDVRDLDLREFLRYFPISAEATEEEFQGLHERYGENFDFAEHETLSDMPVPVHRYKVSDVEAVLRRYAGIGHDDLTGKYTEYYLPETDSYYNFTSDFGPGTFNCTGGWVYDGGATLYSDSAVLILTERDGTYYIQSHLPAIWTGG